METSKKRAFAEACARQIGEEVHLKGWARRTRRLGNVMFLVLQDRSGAVQCVLEGELASEKIENESVVEVSGRVAKTDKTASGAEVLVSSVRVLSRAEPLAFEVNGKTLTANLETQLENRVLSLRHAKSAAAFKIQGAIAEAFSEFLASEGFARVFTPKIVSMGAEGGSSLFALDYFGQKAYLAQSPQFYKQMMVISGLERVYEIGAVYRAEEHNSSRHLNEYISLDVEMGFIESFEELMVLEARLLRFIFRRVREARGEELALHGAELPEIGEIPSLTVEEARALLLRERKKESPEGDLDSEGERLLSELVKEKTGSEFVFLTRYPRESRPAYAMPDAENPKLTASFDLLYKGLEITSGGQRNHSAEALEKSFLEKGLNPKNFKAYIDAFRLGAPPHGGFAIGLERLAAKMLGLKNVRETSAFPRDKSRLTP